MTHDEFDDHPRRDKDSAESADAASGPDSTESDSTDTTEVDEPSGHPRVGWSDSTTVKGTPTPGHRTPVGQPEEPPSIVAHRLTGTTPQATNEPPEAPPGAGSQPTVPRPVDEGPKAVVPDFQPVTPPAQPDPVEPEKRPENPFAPKVDDTEDKRRFPLARPKTPSAEPELPAKRAAQKTSRLKLGGRGGGGGDGSERVPLGGRNVVALTIAGIAVVAIVALIASTALWWFNRDTDVAGPSGPEAPVTPGPVLSAEQMLSPAMAKEIDPSRTWEITLDQAGVNDSSPGVACIGPLAPDQPIPDITQLRSLSASGGDRTAALHRADAYATEEEAQRVFEFRSAELGACTDTPLYVEKGLDVTGLGDEALGVRLLLLDTPSEYHSVVLARTGRVVNLLDVVRAEEPIDMEAQVKALGLAINHQCGPAVGLCTAPTTSVEVGVPPAGGEQPGFLTSGDIPRLTPGTGTWRGNPPATQISIQDGSSCEAIDLASVGGSGVTRQQRTYLLRNDAAAPLDFGIDQVVLEMESSNAAQELLDRINDNIRGCEDRTLTSEMVEEASLSTPGQDGVEIRGHWYVVDSQIDQAQSQRYRVGIFTAADRFVYLRSNPTQDFDFTDEAWIGVNLRAGERITQVL